MTQFTSAFLVSTFGYRVRELVCTYRPLRDGNGNMAVVPTLVLKTPQTAARTLAPLLASEAVEVFGVACLSTRCCILAWHVLSRGSRTCTLVSLPEVFVPAVMTPGTTGLVVLHNHPSGDPTPSVEDIALTKRLQAAAAILDLRLLDHLIAGDVDRYYSFREHGLLGSAPEDPVATDAWS